MGNALAGTLEIQMLANMARLQKDMDDAKRIVGNSMASVQTAVRATQSALGALGIGLSGAMFVSLIKGSIDAQDRLNDLKDTTTLTVKELAGISFVAKMSGSDLEATVKSIDKLAANMGRDSERFRELGITAKNPIEALKQLSDIFRQLDDPQQRAALGTAALGKQWETMGPLLMQGSGAIQSLIDKGYRLSDVTEESVAQAALFNDQMDELKLSVEATTTRMANSMLPALNDIAAAMRTAAQDGGVLQALLVGIGGLATGVFTDDLMPRKQKIAKDLEELRGMMDSETSSWARFLSNINETTREKNNTQVNAINTRMLRLSQELQSIQEAEAKAAAKPAADAAAAKATAAAAARAAAFLKTGEEQKKVYDSLLGKINEYDARLLQELNTGRKLTEAEKLGITVKDKLTAAQQRAIKPVLDKVKAHEAALAAAQQYEKLETSALSLRADQMGVLQAETQTILDGTQAMRDDTAEMGLTAEALTALKLARIQDTIAIQQRKLAILDGGIETEEIASIRATIAALEGRQTAVVDQSAQAMRTTLESNISGGIIDGFKAGDGASKIFEDTTKRMFAEMVLEPQIKATVTAGVDWVQAMVANTLATQANTANNTATKTDWGSTWGWVILVLAAIYKVFDMLSIKAGDMMTQGTATRNGFTGQHAITYTSETMGVTDNLTGDTRYGTLGTLATNNLNDATLNIIETYADAGDALGILGARTGDFTAEINTSGDVVAALSSAIGTELVPAIQLFQREGETLQQTAVRLTDTFRATNDFITALGVSQSAAFGGFGLAGAAGRDALIAASGGLSEFTSSAQAFVQNFLTPAQQLQPALDDVGRTFSRLGIEGISTNEQFAELVRQQMALGNTDVVAQLLSVADSFNTVTSSAAEARREIEALFNKETFGTMIDYLRAVGRAANENGASASIAAATIEGSNIAVQEAAGTAAYAATNQFTTPSAIEDLSQTGFATFWEIFRELFSWLWDKMKSLPSMIWDYMKQLPEQIWDYMKQLPTLIYEAIKGLFSNGPGNPTDPSGGPSLSNGFGLWSANGNAFGPGGHYAFANGGAFTNGIYSSPTPFLFANGGGFSRGVMGEAGDEAVMPLTRRNGILGVRADGGSNAEHLMELRALRQDMNRLMASVDKNTKRSTDLLYNMTDDGQSLRTTAV